MLHAENLTKRYRDGAETRTVLDGVSFKVDPGELVALRGPSGSGKTTLLKLIAGVLEPDEGEIRVSLQREAARSLAGLGRREGDEYRLRALGFVLQRPRLVASMSAIQNAGLRLMSCGMARGDAQQAVLPLLARLDLTRDVDTPARKLSDGQRQRVAIAAALSTSPKLLIADEPTGNLDAENSVRVLALLSEVCKEQDVAALVATHDPQVSDVADRTLMLRGGRIAEATGVAGL
jgi:putative ABC transport system ATP-binding protein